MLQYYSLFFIACLGTSLNTVWLYKKYQQSAGTKLGANVRYFLINGVFSGLVSLAVIFVGGGAISVTPYSLAVAAVIVLSSDLHVFSTLKAYEKGKVATVSVLSTVGTIILSCLWGVVVLGEELSAARIAAITMMLAATVLITYTGSEKSAKGIGWLYALSVLGGSAVSILNKQHQVETNFRTVDTLSFCVIAAAVRTVIYIFVMFFVLMKKGKSEMRFSRRPTAFAVASAVMSGSCYIITLLTAKYLDIVITSPLSTGLSIIVSVLFPWIVYRERLSTRQIAGAALSLAGAVVFLLC